MLSIFINEREFFMSPTLSVLEACQYVGIKIPRFCYHERLSIAGNCRMCLVETDKSPKPVASCATPLLAGMGVYTETPMVLKARETVLESLLINHPLDCPICDQGGECDLQDQYYLFGAKASRFYGVKRSVDDIYIGPIIKMIMTRCIHCTRCVRFADEVCGTPLLGTLSRGMGTEIGNYTNRFFLSEMSGNVVDLCPVGALTTQTTAFKFRPWELQVAESLDLMDGGGSTLYLHYSDFGILRVLPKKNIEINEVWLSDKARFAITALNSFVPGACSSSLAISQPAGATFVVSADIDLETLRALRQLCYSSPDGVIVEHFGLKLCQTNFYSSEVRASYMEIGSAKNCYLVATNPKCENFVLNTRIRARFRQTLNITSFGFFYAANFSIAFMKLHILDVISLFRGKSTYCNLLRKDSCALFVVGHATLLRVPALGNLLHVLSNKFPSLYYYYVQLHSNSEGLNYFGVSTYTRRRTFTQHLYGLQLSDSILSRKYLRASKSVTWCNTFYSEFWQPSNFILVKSIYELGGLFINLEQRVQRASTQQLVLARAHAFSYTMLLQRLFTSFEKSNFSDGAFFMAYANHASCYAVSRNGLPRLVDPTVICFGYSNYPLKPVFDNSYCSTATAQHSSVLAACAQQQRFFEQLF